MFEGNAKTPKSIGLSIVPFVLEIKLFDLQHIRAIIHNFQFDCSTVDSLYKCLFKTVYSTSKSTHVDALKFRLAQYDTFYKNPTR